MSLLTRIKKWLAETDSPPFVQQYQRAGKGSVSIQSGGSVNYRSNKGNSASIQVGDCVLSYDGQAGMVYLTLKSSRVAKTITVTQTPMINLDYNEAGTLVGVEIEVGHNA